MPPEFTPVRRGARVRRGRKAWRALCRCAAGGEEGTEVLFFRPVARLALRAWKSDGAAAAESVSFPNCASTANRRWRGCRTLRGQCRPRRQSARRTVPGVAAVAPAPRDRGAPIAWSSALEAGVPKEGCGASVHRPTPPYASPFPVSWRPAADSAATGERRREKERRRGGEKASSESGSRAEPVAKSDREQAWHDCTTLPTAA